MKLFLLLFILVSKSRGRAVMYFWPLWGIHKLKNLLITWKKKKYIYTAVYIKCCYKGYALQPVICICLHFFFSFPDPNLSLFAAFAIWPLRRSPAELLPQPPLTPGEQTAIMGN